MKDRKTFIDDMADTAALQKFAYAEQKHGFFLGDIHPDHNVQGQAGVDDDRHVFIVAGSRAGKGVTLLIQNLMRWDSDDQGRGGGIFCIDPKGENAAITACKRGDIETAKKWGSSVKSCLGQKVAILDPLNIVQGPARAYRVDYNPFLDVDIEDEDGAAGEMETFCEAVVMQEDGSGGHWTESAATILAGTIEWALFTQPRHAVTWPFIRKTLLAELSIKQSDPAKTHPFAARLREVETHEGLAQMAATIIDGAGDNERGSFITTLTRQLKWLNHRKMSEHLTGRSFSLKRAVLENWSVYVCVPPGMINRFRRWLRLMVAIALDAKTQSPFDHEGPQTLFILDEFSALGAFSQIESGASNLAGYGVKLITVIQNIGQLENTYERNWETFLGNAGVIVAWGLNDKASEDYISHRIGQSMSLVPGFSMSTNQKMSAGDQETVKGGREGTAQSFSLQQLPIIWPNEIRRYGAREAMRAFVITAAGDTFTVLRQPYHQPANKGHYDDPAFIKDWTRPQSKKVQR